MNKTIQSIREELKRNADVKSYQSFQRFFKEEVTFYGVKTGVVSKIAKKYWYEVEKTGKVKIFKLCEELYKSDYCEEAFIVSWWVPNLIDEFTLNDLPLFRKWIEKYINNWAKCDGFCNHSIGGMIEKYPECIDEIKNWAKSNNRWMKRASAVSFIIPAKKGKFLKDVFEISDMLIQEKDDMVQKGYGWLLKEASRLNQKEVFDYVISKKKIIPRTAFRYAIELMPEKLKAIAMKKD
ncbi:MAG: DNA alkylation repair protein [Ignavibacteriales bacterium]|nr:MAG: DNA alkylation repair protein [Ignavibacteriales bacterium]